MSIYPKEQRVESTHKGILYPNRKTDHTCAARSPLPGNVIVIHGVNDVGTYFVAAEEGLCQGLNTRLFRSDLKPAAYSVPTAADAAKVVADPDDLYFKRKADAATHSPVIPFYWGYRAKSKSKTRGAKEGQDNTAHGQQVDQYGNRLDKDRSKGGGPFINATTSLPDMWSRGQSGSSVVDFFMDDPIRPLLDAPGRMYMVLAAYRLAALVSMIRDYDDKETVSIVAHSQGCLISLLAQAVLLDKGLRPVDTLIMNNPPYSLADDFSYANAGDWMHSGRDPAMEPHYNSIDGIQTLHARLTTLANIVNGVCAQKKTEPALPQLKEPDACGLVGARWEAGKDRDNRGKVYLYFCPEDMTVAFQNVQGIGWQGIPNIAQGSQIQTGPEMKHVRGGAIPTGRTINLKKPLELPALKALGAGFFQRVFTIKQRRPDPKSSPQPEKVGVPPHNFVLLLEPHWWHSSKNESTTAHVASGGGVLSWAKDKSLPAASDEFKPAQEAVRYINAEALATPVLPDLYAGAVNKDGKPQTDGKYERNDPIDAAIGVSDRRGIRFRWEVMADPGQSTRQTVPVNTVLTSPDPTAYRGIVTPAPAKTGTVQTVYNQAYQGKAPEDQVRILDVYECCEMRSGHGPAASTVTTGQLLIQRTETATEARLRMQQGVSERSMHGAIVGSVSNHKQVTSYDVAVGQGWASSNPDFHAYLCAVADWRLKDPSLTGTTTKNRPSILIWADFLAQSGKYYNVEPGWRKELIRGNCVYYSKGDLPACLPTVDKRPALVVNEHFGMVGQVVPSPAANKGHV